MCCCVACLLRSLLQQLCMHQTALLAPCTCRCHPLPSTAQEADLQRHKQRLVKEGKLPEEPPPPEGQEQAAAGRQRRAAGGRDVVRAMGWLVGWSSCQPGCAPDLIAAAVNGGVHGCCCSARGQHPAHCCCSLLHLPAGQAQQGRGQGFTTSEAQYEVCGMDACVVMHSAVQALPAAQYCKRWGAPVGSSTAAVAAAAAARAGWHWFPPILPHTALRCWQRCCSSRRGWMTRRPYGARSTSGRMGRILLI